MNRVIIIQLVLFVLLIIGSLSGLISWERVGYVFLAVGIYDLILSFAVWRGWPILRGDIANNNPLRKLDSREAASDEFAIAYDRPSTGFIVQIAGIGILTVVVGIILNIFAS
jgi:hypothetical protein